MEHRGLRKEKYKAAEYNSSIRHHKLNSHGRSLPGPRRPPPGPFKSTPKSQVDTGFDPWIYAINADTVKTNSSNETLFSHSLVPIKKAPCKKTLATAPKIHAAAPSKPRQPTIQAPIPPIPAYESQLLCFNTRLNRAITQYKAQLETWPEKKRHVLNEQFHQACGALLWRFETHVHDPGWRSLGERVLRDKGFRMCAYPPIDGVSSNPVFLLRREVVQDLNAVFKKGREVDMEEQVYSIRSLNARIDVLVVEAEKRVGRLEVSSSTKVGKGLEGGRFETKEKWAREMELWRDSVIGDINNVTAAKTHADIWCVEAEAEARWVGIGEGAKRG
jgi:hypothetical protein